MIDTTAKLARWRLRLFELDFKVVDVVTVECSAVETVHSLASFRADKSRLKNDVPVPTIKDALPES